MPIEHRHCGATILTGESVEYFRLCTLLAGVKMEAKGMRICRGPSRTAQAKRELGIKGNRDKVIEALERMVAEERARQLHHDEGEEPGTVQ